MTRNAELLRKVADVIEQKPDTYYQHDWIHNHDQWVDREDVYSHNESGELIEEVVIDPEDPRFMLCNTRACIAGHAMLASGAYRLRLPTEWGGVRWVKKDSEHSYGTYDTMELAQEQLGLEGVEARVLFGGGWRPKNNPLPDGAHDVSWALRQLAEGAHILHVTDEWCSSFRDHPQWRLFTTDADD